MSYTQPLVRRKDLKNKVIIGIDPAFRKGGFGVCYFDLSDRSMKFVTYDDVLSFQDYLNTDDAPQDAICVIEDSSIQKTIFNLESIVVQIIKSWKVPFSKIKMRNYSFFSIMKICEKIGTHGRNIGKNQAVSSITVGICERKYGKKNVKAVSPRRKGKKWTTHKIFNPILKSEKITWYKNTSNQDERDAAKLALMYKTL